jgi:hypothetical protein
MDALTELYADSGTPQRAKSKARSAEQRRKHGRSRVANGSALLSGVVDQRSVWVRRLRDLIREHLSDLGGEANASTAERSIVRRAAVLEVELEQLETKFASAGAADPNALDLYQRTAGNLRRLLESLGLQRRQRDITGLSLGEVLRQGIDHDRGA